MDALIVVAGCGPAFAQGGEPALRNAIFNGDFLEGRAGWSIGGPDDLEVRTFRTMIAERADAELSLRHDALDQTMTLFSQYPIGVESGREYTLTLTAAGEGTIAFGVYEYDEAGKNTVFPISEPITLTAEPRTYSFSYTASQAASTIRPRIQIIGQAPPRGEPAPQREDGGATAFHVRLLRFALMVPQEVFARSTHWPEWAVSGELTGYEGLSAEERQPIEEATTVERILPPYQPIRSVGAGTYALTTSQFEFGQSVFPEQITILGEPVLAGSIGFELRTAGGRSVGRSDGEAVFLDSQQRVVARQSVRGDGWTLRLSGTLEYDALLIIDLEMRSDEPVELTGGVLSIPLTQEVAQYIRYHSLVTDAGASIFGYGPIPRPGETVEVRHTQGRARIKNDWSPVAPAPEQGVLWEWRRGAPQYFWLGDEERGLGWILEGDQGWSVGEDDLTLALERTAEGVVARVNFITQPTTPRTTWRTRFILQAMPPKPVRPDWFKLRFNRVWNWAPGDLKWIERVEATRAQAPSPPDEEAPPPVRYAQAGGGEKELRPPWEPQEDRPWRDLGLLWWDVWSVGCGSPQVSKPEMMRRYLGAGEYVGHMAMPYFAPTHLSVNDLNGYYYAAKTDEWAKLPPSGGTSLYVKVCPNSFASQYQAYEIGRLIDEYDIKGVYFDNTHPEQCANQAHGCGWVDESGTVHPTIPFLAMRRVFMMVREQFVKRGREPFILKHAGMFPAEVSFVDANLDGEGVYGFDHTEMFTTGEFRASWIGPNQFGVVEVYLPQFAVGTDSELPAGEQVRLGTPRLLALALVHGTPIYCGNAWTVPTFQAWSVLDELRGPTVDFIPYWEWDYSEQLTPRGLYASIYRQPENSVLVVSNLSATKTGMLIPRSELDRLVPGFTVAEDHMHGQRVELDGESLRITVPEKDFRMISLR